MFGSAIWEAEIWSVVPIIVPTYFLYPTIVGSAKDGKLTGVYTCPLFRQFRIEGNRVVGQVKPILQLDMTGSVSIHSKFLFSLSNNLVHVIAQVHCWFG